MLLIAVENQCVRLVTWSAAALELAVGCIAIFYVPYGKAVSVLFAGGFRDSRCPCRVTLAWFVVD